MVSHWIINASLCVSLKFTFLGAKAICKGKFKRDEETKYWLDDVKCVGNEVSLFDCEHRMTHNCGNRERAGADCLGMQYVFLFCAERESAGAQWFPFHSS